MWCPDPTPLPSTLFLQFNQHELDCASVGHISYGRMLSLTPDQHISPDILNILQSWYNMNIV